MSENIPSNSKEEAEEIYNRMKKFFEKLQERHVNVRCCFGIVDLDSGENSNISVKAGSGSHFHQSGLVREWIEREG